MAKLDGQMTMKYLALGAGAVGVPAVVSTIAGISTTLAAIPFWGQALFGTMTIGGLVLAGLGVGLVDQLFFNK